MIITFDKCQTKRFGSTTHKWITILKNIMLKKVYNIFTRKLIVHCSDNTHDNNVWQSRCKYVSMWFGFCSLWDLYGIKTTSLGWVFSGMKSDRVSWWRQHMPAPSGCPDSSTDSWDAFIPSHTTITHSCSSSSSSYRATHCLHKICCFWNWSIIENGVLNIISSKKPNRYQTVVRN